MILLPWAAPVPLSTIGWLWIYDSLLSVVNWTLTHDLLAGPGEFYFYKVVNAVTPWTIEPFNPPQWLGDPTPALGAVISVHAWRIIPSRSSSSSRSARSPPRSRTRPRSTGQRAAQVLVRDAAAAAPDRDGGSAVRDRLHGDRHDGRLHPHAGRTVQLDAHADDARVLHRHPQRRDRPGRGDLAVPPPHPHSRGRADAALRAQGRGDLP